MAAQADAGRRAVRFIAGALHTAHTTPLKAGGYIQYFSGTGRESVALPLTNWPLGGCGCVSALFQPWMELLDTLDAKARERTVASEGDQST